MMEKKQLIYIHPVAPSSGLNVWEDTEYWVINETSDYGILLSPWICTIEPVIISQTLTECVFLSVQWVYRTAMSDMCTLSS